jgi:hypothetical protein
LSNLLGHGLGDKYTVPVFFVGRKQQRTPARQVATPAAGFFRKPRLAWIPGLRKVPED